MRKAIPEREIERFTEKAKREAEILAQELYGGPVKDRNVGTIEVIDAEKRSRRSINRPMSGSSTPEPASTPRSRSRSSSKTATPRSSRASTPNRDKMKPRRARNDSQGFTVKDNIPVTPKTLQKPLVEPTTPKTPKVEPASPKDRKVEPTSPKTPKEPRTPKTSTAEPDIAKSPTVKPVTPRTRGRKPKEPKIEVVEVENYDFSDSPKDIICLTKNESPTENLNDSVPSLVDVSSPQRLSSRSLRGMVGEEGYGQGIEFLWDSKWIRAKVISPPRTGGPPPVDIRKNIYIHFNGWNKSFDQWVPLDPKVLRPVLKTETSFEFDIGERVMARWSDSTFYPGKIVKHQNNGYVVEFYDGFRKPIRPNQVKRCTRAEEEIAIKMADANYVFSAVPKKRKSLYKREKDQSEPEETPVESENTTKRTRLDPKQNSNDTVTKKVSTPSSNRKRSPPPSPVVTPAPEIAPATPTTKKAKKASNLVEKIERPTRRRSTRHQPETEISNTPKNDQVGTPIEPAPPVVVEKPVLKEKPPKPVAKLQKPAVMPTEPPPPASPQQKILEIEKERLRVEQEEEEMAQKAKEIEEKQKEIAAKKAKLQQDQERAVEEERLRQIESEKREKEQEELNRQKMAEEMEKQEEIKRQKLAETVKLEKEDQEKQARESGIDLTGLSEREREIIMTMKDHHVPLEIIQTAIDKIRIGQLKNDSTEVEPLPSTTTKSPPKPEEPKKVSPVSSPKVIEKVEIIEVTSLNTGSPPVPVEKVAKENPDLRRTRRTSVLRSSPRASPRSQSETSSSASPGRKKPSSNPAASPASSTSSRSEINGKREEARRLRNRSQTRDEIESDQDTDKNDINSNAAVHNKGDLVWALWKDTKPYGAIVLSVEDTTYTVRYGDGVEANIKHEMVTDIWNPATTVEEDFLIFFNRLYKSSDPKVVQKSLKVAKVAFEKAKNDRVFRIAAPISSSDGGTAQLKTKTESIVSDGGGEPVKTSDKSKSPVARAPTVAPLPTVTKKISKGKTLQSLTDKLSEKANSSIRIETPVADVQQLEIRSRPPRKSKPMRRKSDTSGERVEPVSTSPKTTTDKEVEKTSSPRRTRRSTQEKVENEPKTEPPKSLKMMPKSLKESIQHSQHTTFEPKDVPAPVPVKMMPKSVKESVAGITSPTRPVDDKMKVEEKSTPTRKIPKSATPEQKPVKSVSPKSPAVRRGRPPLVADERKKTDEIEKKPEPNSSRKSTRLQVEESNVMELKSTQKEEKSTPVRKSARFQNTTDSEEQSDKKAEDKPPTRRLTRPSTSRFATNSPSRSPAAGQTPKSSDHGVSDVTQTSRQSVARPSTPVVEKPVLEPIPTDKTEIDEPLAKRQKRSSRSSQSSDIEKKSPTETTPREISQSSPRILLERITMTPPIPKYSTGDHILMSTGKSATILRPGMYRNSQWEYYVKVDNGPKIKEIQQNMSPLPSKDVVSPIISDIVTQAAKRANRRSTERKKSESIGTGWSYELQGSTIRPAKAFTGIDKEFRCHVESCKKSFRKQSGLEAHMKHYHPDVIVEPHPVFLPQTIQLQSTNSAALSEDGSSLAGTRDNSSASEDDIVQPIKLYQCSCGWEGEQFWSETPDGIPMRNHICQRPRGARNLKNTHLLKVLPSLNEF